ncbi:MAG: tetratricopeptide repeat protein [Terriglobales bacterium]
MKSLRNIGALVLGLAVLVGLRGAAFAKDESKWIEVHTAHFSVITDGGEKRGREVALRMEQMRGVFGQLVAKPKLNMSVPITVIALKSDSQYGAIAPNKLSFAESFYVPGYDRVYIVLNLFELEPWRGIAHALGHYFLNYNYPPVQGWFDEGLAEYFGAVQIDKEVNIGGDPELAPEWHEDIFFNMVRDPNVPQSLTQMASSPVWISMTDLFTMKHDSSGRNEGSHNTMYYAQAWLVMHYMIDKNKLPEVGTYFDLVQNKKVPVDKAITQAFDMTPDQLEDAVKKYLESMSTLGIALDQSKKPNGSMGTVMQPNHFPVPVDADELGAAVTALPEPKAKAILGDMMVRIPDHRLQALNDLKKLASDPKGNEAAERALARDDLQLKKFDLAEEELAKAAELNPRDPWVWYYRSVLKYRKAQAARQEMQGIANMMQDLRAVIDWYPDLADAYNMLGVARVEGGGWNSALEAQKQAVALSPRNPEYQFNLGQIYVAGKKWDQARDVFTRLKEGTDKQAATAAKQQLADLATLQKYGVRPEHQGAAESPVGAASAPGAASASGSATASDPGNTTSASSTKTASARSGGEDDEDSDAAPTAPPVKPATTGPVLFLKGKIVSSDCSKAPEAAITVLSGMTTYTMHASDYKSLVVVGADQFSCEWANRLVSVNYRATGKRTGEVVSLEVR